MTFNDRSVHLHIFDTASPNEQLNIFRRYAYEDADVVLLCFSLVSRDTFSTLSTFWISEIRRHRRNVPVLLIGLKKDLRLNQNDDSFLSSDECFQRAREIDARGYFECP